MKLSRSKSITSWTLQILTAAILAQTLFFKFTAAEESVYIFSKLGAEPVGRLGTGVAELIAVVLLLVPRTAVLGAIMAAGLISGAIASHLTVLGVVVKDDGGLLFALALAVFFASTGVVFLRRSQIPIIGKRFTPTCTCRDCVMPTVA